MSIESALVRNMTDSIGAAKLLGSRFGNNSYSVDSVHQLVKRGKLRAYIFQGGILVERTEGTQSRGKDLLFLNDDLQSVPLPQKRGKPTTKTRANTAQGILKAQRDRM